MTTNRRSKASRHRGSWTCFGGHKKKRRGAGNRGGRGNAGSGKRGDSNKPRFWKTRTFGRNGFIKHGQKSGESISLRSLDYSVDKWLTAKKVSEKDGVIVINLEELGYGKLIGTGNVTRKYTITVPLATERAVERVTAAGGQVVTNNGDMENTAEQSS